MKLSHKPLYFIFALLFIGGVLSWSQASSVSASRGAVEVCNNNTDDDGDGTVDENACRIDTTGTPVSGNGIVPETWGDNPTCQDLGYEFGFKIEGQGGAAYTGTFSFDNSSVTLSSDGDYVDWSSTLPLDAVFVKGGSTGGNLYIYDPESMGPDTGLSVPGGGTDGDAISHIEFCYDYELDVSKTATGSYDRTITWELDKSVTPDAHSGFPGDSFQSTWTVNVTKNVVEDNYSVTGNITINNPAPFAVDFSVSDLIDSSINATVSCPSYTVPAGGTVVCTYSAGESDGIDGTQSSNEATVTSLTEGVDGGSDTAGITFTATVYGDESVTVDDDRDTEGQFPATISTSTTFDYDETFSCSTNAGDYTGGVDNDNYPNTATAKGANTDLSDDADVDVTCYLWDVSKTADGSYDDQYKWDITKTVDPESQSGFAGDTLSWEWTITWSSSFDEEVNHAVSGVITVDNPAPLELTVDVADELTGGFAATVDCGDGPGDTSLTIAAGGSGTCDYTASPNSQLAQNTATATRNGFSVSDTVDVTWTKGEDLGLDATISDDNHADIPVDLSLIHI